MRIFFICHRFPYPPARGGKIRPFNIIRHLSRYAEVTVASLWRSEEERIAGEGLAKHCSRILAEPVSQLAANVRMVARLPLTSPSSFGNFWSPRLAARVQRELRDGRYDLVFVHCSSVAPYVVAHRGCPKVLDFGDMDSEKWSTYSRHRPFPLSAGYWLEALKLRRVERELARRFDLSTCTTAAEHDTLCSLESSPRTGWFPNGVDAEYFSPAGDDYDPDLICFSGRMDYFPNQQAVMRFCGSTFGLIRKQRPAARLVIVGAEPPGFIRALAERPGITVTGTVPDIRPHVRGAAVSVAPLDVARGTQNKILESMALGVPVVCSTLASRGVDARPGEHLLTADSPAECASTVIEVLADRQRRRALASAGRERVLSHHSWAHSMRRMDALLDGLHPSGGPG
ncbi:MAG: TIGR03087 family PEP-CTERM/XrtA system glycosyltransferase [Gammaproteobacteria bacterium]|nr:TIGR03087 family PEP-CTERM/XrtA system glycosyltransferase [Gammaproteobacteria bacterium]